MSGILNLAWTSFPALVAGLGFIAFLIIQTRNRPIESALMGVVFCLIASAELFEPRNSVSPFSLVIGGSLGELLLKVHSQWNELIFLMSFAVYFVVIARLKTPDKIGYDRSWIFFILILVGTIFISGSHFDQLVNRYFLMTGVSFIVLLLTLEKFSYGEKALQIRMALRFTLSTSVLAFVIAPDWATTRDWVGGVFQSAPRFQGITIHPNVLGILCVILIAIEKRSPSKSSKFWQLLSAVAILGSGSRAALGAAVVSIVFWRFQKRFTTRKMIVTGALVTFFLAITIPKLSNLIPLFQPRAVSFQTAFDTWQTSKMIGVGPFPQDELGISQVLFPHNQVLYLLSLGGLLLLGIFIVLVVRSGIKIAIFDSGRSIIFYYIFLVFMLFDNTLRISNINFLFVSLSVVILLICPKGHDAKLAEDRIDTLGVGYVKIT